MMQQVELQVAATDMKHVIDVAMATAMRVHAGDGSPTGNCVIDIAGHGPCCFDGVTFNASRSAADMIGASFRFEARRRPERRS
jgi:hypothetical protein